ncbi:MAG TPA: ECF transporter S component [Firmicutes bacterium]|nr:ECF transporter S component [Bacillota bacterium]
MESYDKRKTLFLAQFSLLLAIEAIVCFTALGSIPIGPIVATLSHVPVIITAIVLGTKAGAAMGFFFGLFSFIVWTFIPPSPIAFVFTPFYSLGQFQGNFWSLVICFVPRILIGVVTGAVHTSLVRRRRVLSYILSGVLGTLVNTFLVLGGIYVFFGQNYASVIGVEYSVLLNLIGMAVLTNGVPEAVIGGFLALAVGMPLKQYVQRSIGAE